MSEEKKGPDSKYNDYLFHEVNGQSIRVAGLKTLFFNGDSISSGYALALKDNLRGKMNAIHRKDLPSLFPDVPFDDSWGGPASSAVGLMERYIDEEDFKVDLVTQNAGIHEVILEIPLEEYLRQLNIFIDLVESHSIPMIWINSTPIVEALCDKYAGYDAQIDRFNAAAAELMGKHDIPIIDLHRFVRELMASEGVDNIYRDALHHKPEIVIKQGRFLAEAVFGIVGRL